MNNKLIGVINGQFRNFYNNNNKQTEPKNLEEKREMLIGTIKSLRSQTDKIKYVKTSLSKPTAISHAFNSKDSYNVTDIVDKINRLNKGDKNGYVYFFDTETLGSAKNIAESIGSKPSYIEQKAFAVTELYLMRGKMENGKLNEVQSVVRFTSSPKAKDLDLIIGSLKNERNMTSGEVSTLQRLAGYSPVGAISEKGIAVNFDENANYLDERLLRRGASNLSNNVQFLVGTEEYKDEVRRIYDIFSNLNKESAPIVGANSDAFDINIMKDFFMSGGFTQDEVDNLFSKGNYIDVQKIIKQISDTELYEQMSRKGIERNLKVGTMAEALGAENIDNILEVDEVGNVSKINKAYHVAEYDTKVLGNVTASMMENFNNFVTTATEKESYDISNSMFYANSGIKRTNSYDFKIINGTPNTYNTNVLNANNMYSLKIVDLSKYSFDEVESKYNEYFKNSYEAKNKGKKYVTPYENISIDDEYKKGYLAIFENLDNSTDEVNYMFLKDINDLQELKNNGSITEFTNHKDVQDVIDRSIDARNLDKKRQIISGFKDASGYNGFDSLSDYFDIYNKELDLLKKYNINDISENQEAIKEFNANFLNKNGFIVEERKVKYNLIKPEFKDNYDFYDNIIKNINKMVTNNDTVSLSPGIDSRNTIKSIKTTAYNKVISEVEDKIYNDLKDDEILSYVIQKDDVMSKEYDSRVKESKMKKITKNLDKDKLTKSEIEKAANTMNLSKSQYKKIMRSVYEDVNGYAFDREDSSVIATVFGKKPVIDTISSVQTLDILGVDGEYTSVSLKSKNALEQSLKNNIYKKINDKSKQVKDTKRQHYINDIVNDLENRGIINRSDSKAILGLAADGKVESVESMISMLSYTIDNKVNEVYDIVLKHSGMSLKDEKEAVLLIANNQVNFESITKEDFNQKVNNTKKVKTFMNKYRVKNVYTASAEGANVFGVPLAKFLSDKYDNVDGYLTNLTYKAVSNSMPTFIAASYGLGTDTETGNALLEQTNRVKSYLTDEKGLNWNEQNADKFIDDILGYNDYKRKYKNVLDINTKDNTSSMVTMFVDNKLDNGEIEHLMLIANKEKTNYILNNIDDMDKIKENVFTFKLPQISNIEGIEYLKQSNDSYKLVEYNLKVKRNFDTGVNTYTQDNSIDDVINKLKYSMSHIKNKIEEGNIEGADSIARIAMKEIYENKPITGLTLRPFKDGNGNIGVKNSIGINLGDFNTQNYRNFTPLVYSLEYALDDNTELGKKLIKNLEEFGGSIDNNNTPAGKLMDRIRKYNSGSNSDFVTYEKLDDSIKTFIGLNLQDISKSLLENERFMASNTQIKGVLEQISKTGSFFTKDSGDASSGLFSIIDPLKYNPDSYFSAVGRPLDNQVQSAFVFFKDDALVWAERNISKEFADKFADSEEYLKYLNVKPSHGFFSESKLEADLFGKVNNVGQSIGFTTTATKMSSKTLINRANSLMSNDNAIGDIISDLLKTGVTTNKEEVLNAVQKILSVSNIYEDSGISSPILARSMFAKSVGTKKVDSEFFEKNKVNVGDVLSENNALGKAAGYKGRDAIITEINRNENKLRIQYNKDYFDFKIGVGSDEKLVVHSPKVSSEHELMVTESVFKKLSGGSNVIFNPDYAKHESFTSVINPYINSILNHINNDEDMEAMNKILSNHFKEQPMSIRYDSFDNRYIMVKQDNFENKYNVFEEYNNLFKDIENDKRFSSIKEDFRKIGIISSDDINGEVNKLNIDMFLLKDNTIENVQGDENIGKGASSTYRGQNAVGLYFDSNNIVGSREFKDGKFEKLFQDIIENKREAILRTDISNTKVKQAANIFETLKRIYVDASESTVDGNIIGSPKQVKSTFDDLFTVEDFDIRTIAAKKGKMSADELPSIFRHDKLNDEGARVNAYRLDLSNLKVKIENPIAIKDTTSNKHTVVKPKKYLDYLYIPAMATNKDASGAYYLTESQRITADLLNAIISVENGSFDSSITDMQRTINTLAKKQVESLVYELSDKRGLFKDSLGGKIPFSGRMKVSKLATPYLDENGMLLDEEFRRISNRNGKMYSAAQIGLQDFTNKGLSMETVGRQLIDGYDSSETALKIINDVVKDKSNPTASELDTLGRRYLSEVGVMGTISRDPVMLSTSEVATRFFLNESLSGDVVAMDSVTAKLMNADGDGDDINIFLNEVLKKNMDTGEVELRSLNSKEMQQLSKIEDFQSNMYTDMILKLNESISEKDYKNNGIQDFNTYKKYVEDLRGSNFINAMDYSTDESTAIAGLLARNMKGRIGQISNPNYFIKSAADYYFKNSNDLTELRKYKVMVDFLDTTEQKLIDVKSIKTGKSALALDNLVKNYMASFNIIGTNYSNSNMQKRLDQRKFDAVKSLYKSIYDFNIFDRKYGDSVNEDVLASITERILNGNYRSDDMLEESLGIITEMLKDEKASEIFWSPFTRQSVMQNSKGKRLDLVDKLLGLINQEGIEGHDPISEILGDGNIKSPFLQDTVFIKNQDDINKVLNKGDLIIGKSGNEFLESGVYRVLDISDNKSNYKIKLRDFSTLEDIELTGDSFLNISKKLYGFNSNDDVNANPVKILQDILPSKIREEIFSGRQGLDKNRAIYNGIKNNSPSNILEKTVFDFVKDNGTDVFDNIQDAADTVKALEELGYTNDSKSLLRQLNDSIIKKGSNKSYYARKREVLLNSGFLNNPISPSGYDNFIKNVITPQIKNPKVSKKVFTKYNRYNIDAIVNMAKTMDLGIDLDSSDVGIDIDTVRNSFINEVIKEFSSKDVENKANIIRQVMENQHDSDYLKSMLNIDIDKINEILNDKTISTEEMIKNSKNVLENIRIGYGEYAGYRINQLTDKQLSKILLEGAESQLENKNIVNQTTAAIEKLFELTREGYSRDIDLNFDVDFGNVKEKVVDINKENIRKINEDIKKRGAKRNTSKNAFKEKATGAASDILKKESSAIGHSSGGGKDIFKIAGLVTAGLLAASFVSGREYTANKKMLNQKKDEENKVTQGERADGKRGMPLPTPQSFPQSSYKTSQGASYNISGAMPHGASGHFSNNLISRMARGADKFGTAIRSEINDNRKEIQDYEINNAVTDMEF